ncbi:hypothetical protein J2W34_000771 [Variovorax boronicumulans]|uniref:hypothetical protein n=1 Tax=Variovorax boronicumulans TaxID=436515 RepID=UPI002785E432|nr:hypothetical protein [Variovorax boronicumulans]MDQ0068997.1 hypothetical protein [Variovorax boronicumulans]
MKISAGGAARVVGALAVVVLVWVFVAHPPLSPGDWASWVQAVGAIAAIAATGVYVNWQHTLETKRAEEADLKARTRSHSAILLALQNLGSELRRMNTLIGYQFDSPGNPIIHPDVVAECNAMALLFTQLPIDQIATLGMMDVYLDLRRAANELGTVYEKKPEQGDGFYRRNREQLEKLQKLCSTHAIALMKEIETLDPELYAKNKEKMNRL